MTSVTRFLRQIPTGQTLYDVPNLNTIASAAWEFIPTSSNYVGNYPPGVIVPASAIVKLSIQNAADGLISQTPIIRDMGKTIYAPIATSPTNLTPIGVSQYFRQIQVLVPQDINTNQGFIGGTAGSVFGVIGGSHPGSSYLTVYVPTSVGGEGLGWGYGPMGQM